MAKRRNEQAFQDVSSYSNGEGKKRRKGRRVRIALQCVACLLCVIMILFGSALIYISTDVISELSTTSITKDKDQLGIRDDAIVSSVQDDSITNIAMFGVDSRNSEFRGLSDVTMILTVDHKHNTVKMPSILRDSLVNIEGDGYGGGYYDRYLPRTRCPAVLLCRTHVMREDIPMEDHDVFMDYLITEKGITACKA